VNLNKAPPRERGNFGAALLGGLIGSLATAALLFLAVPQFSGRVVRDGLLRDPQILPDTVEALRASQFKPVLEANRAAIETPFASSWKGSAKPEVTLVEFFDYACPYCKASNPAIDRLVKEEPGLRVVYRELPILGPDSVTAARLSLAASKLGRFGTFHDRLWAIGKPVPENLVAAAGAAQVSPAPPNDPQIEAELKRNLELAGQLGATGTPVFVVGDKVMNGAVGYDTLKAAVAEARKAKS